MECESRRYGAMVEIQLNGAPEERTVIDSEEMDGLVSSLDYLANINSSVTTLSSFNAGFTTKGGLRVSAFMSKRNGQIELALRTMIRLRGDCC